MYGQCTRFVSSLMKRPAEARMAAGRIDDGISSIRLFRWRALLNGGESFCLSVAHVGLSDVGGKFEEV